MRQGGQPVKPQIGEETPGAEPWRQRGGPSHHRELCVILPKLLYVQVESWKICINY